MKKLLQRAGRVLALGVGLMGTAAWAAPDTPPPGAPPQAAVAASAPASAASPRTLRVAIKPAKPFAFLQDGQWKGYSVDVWQAVAARYQWRFEWVPMDTVPQALAAVQAGQADVVVGAISVTEERERVMDFSHPFYESGLQIVTRATGTGTLLQAMGGLMSWQVLGGLGGLLVCLLVVSWLLWRLERHNNEENFPKPMGAGLKESVWWSTNILIAGGCENISPTGTPGRLVAVVWMLGGIAFTSYITAVFTSTLTVDRLTAEVHSLSDLQGQIVATLEGSSSDVYLNKRGIPVEGHAQLDDAMGSLLAGDAKAVVYDTPMLRHWLFSHPRESDKLTLAGEAFARQPYAFALPAASERRKTINEALLALRAEGDMDEFNKRWFGSAVEGNAPPAQGGAR